MGRWENNKRRSLTLLQMFVLNKLTFEQKVYHLQDLASAMHMVSGQCPKPRHQIELFYLEYYGENHYYVVIKHGKMHNHQHKTSTSILLA
jgi:hypothetical protein